MATDTSRLRMALGWTGLITSLFLLSQAGCHHSSNPYLQPSSGNPWATPNAAAMPLPPTTQLPPPVSPGVPGYTPAPPVTGAPATPPMPGTVPTARSNGIQGPDWDNPGSLTQQRERANVFDPFANNEVAPEIVGGRPRDFQKPMNEATRAQPYRDTRSPF